MPRLHPLVLAALLSMRCYGGNSGETTASDPSSGTDATVTTGTTGDATTSAPTTSATTSSTSGVTGSDEGGTRGPVSATASETTTAPTTGDLDTGTTTDEPPPPPDPAIHYVGRHDDSDPGHVRMGWSGVGAVFRFNGTGASVRLDDAGRYFTVLVDGAVQPTLATQKGEQSYPVAQGLPAGEHTVELYRRTEGSFGPTVFLGVDLEGELLAPPPVTRRIEIIGDSITCGYGNEGTSPCSFSAETENHYMTYGAIAARSLGAEISAVAWSGKGVIYNYGDNVDEPLPTIYDRLIATNPAPWGFAWQPDVVVINLGTNDFSTGGDPSEAVFVSAYLDFLTHLRAVYPDAFILLVEPILFGQEATMVAGYLQSVVDQRHTAGDAEVALADINVKQIGLGCDGHPSVATHEAMAARLTQALQMQLGW